MGSLMKKSFDILIILLFPLLLSCATTLPSRQYTQGSIIDMGHYSVIGPPGGAWVVNIQKGQGTVEFRKSNASQSTGLIDETALIKVLRNWIVDEKLKRLSEEEVANDYRNREEADMIRRGVMTGQYELSDVKKDITMIGDKRVYLMSYKTLGWSKGSKGPTDHKVVGEAVLYLFFPADFKERHFFYIFLINHSYSQGSLQKGDLTPIIPVISSLKIK
jgi:hypothetical protein